MNQDDKKTDASPASKDAGKRSEPKAASKPMGGMKVRTQLASVLHWTDRFSQSLVGVYDRVFTLKKEDEAAIYLDVGVDCATAGKSATAAEALEKSLKLQPNNKEAWFHLGKVRSASRDFAGAIAAFEKAKGLGNDSFDFHFAYAEALSDRDDLPGCVTELRAAVAIKSDAAEAFYRLGVALDKLKQYEESVVAFQKAIEISPREANYYQSMGFTFDTMGQHEKAVGCFKRAVELERRK